MEMYVLGSCYTCLVFLFFGAITELREATVNFVISVRPLSLLRGTTRYLLDGFPCNFLFAGFCENLSRKFTLRWNFTGITGTVREDLCKFFSRILRWRGMFRTNVVEKIETNIPCSVSPPPPENPAVYEIMWKNMLEPDRAQMTV